MRSAPERRIVAPFGASRAARSRMIATARSSDAARTVPAPFAARAWNSIRRTGCGPAAAAGASARATSAGRMSASVRIRPRWRIAHRRPYAGRRSD